MNCSTELEAFRCDRIEMKQAMHPEWILLSQGEALPKDGLAKPGSVLLDDIPNGIGFWDNPLVPLESSMRNEDINHSITFYFIFGLMRYYVIENDLEFYHQALGTRPYNLLLSMNVLVGYQ